MDGPAPYQSCVSCFRGDTDTVVVFFGTAEWHIVGLMKVAGLSQDEASATFGVFAQEVFGTDPGMVPGGYFQTAFRLCAACAEKSSTPNVPLVSAKDYGTLGAEVEALIEPRPGFGIGAETSSK